MDEREILNLIFWVLLAAGGGLASILKKRKENQLREEQRKAREEARRAQEAAERAGGAGKRSAPVADRAAQASPATSAPPAKSTLEESLARSLESLFGVQREQPAQPVPRLQPPPPPPPPLAPTPAQSNLGAELSTMSGFDDDLAGVGLGSFESMAALPSTAFEAIGALPTSSMVGRLIESGPAETVTSDARGWRPSGSWREAIILREILDPPRAWRSHELPSLER